VPVTIKVKAPDEVKVQRDAAARCVVAHFGSCIPADSRVLCFLDDNDTPALRREFGEANRGVYVPINENTNLGAWPPYVTSSMFDAGVPAIDDFIYLSGSTSADEIALTMTLAHELQHAIQHANASKLWAVNSLVSHLHRSTITDLNLKWTDIPIEVEARIVSKRVAVMFFGEQRVQHHIDGKMAEHIADNDAADWQFIRSLTPSSSVDLVIGTYELFQRLKCYKPELERELRSATKDNPQDYKDVGLDAFFTEA